MIREVASEDPFDGRNLHVTLLINQLQNVAEIRRKTKRIKLVRKIIIVKLTYVVQFKLNIINVLNNYSVKI